MLKAPVDFLVIDGSMLAHKAFFGMGAGLTSPDGQPSGIYVGFFNKIERMRVDLKPRRVFVTMEGECPSRHALYAEFLVEQNRIAGRPPLTDEQLKLVGYKAGRSAKPEDYKVQMAKLPYFCEQMGWTILRRDDLEADDMIASFCKQASARGHTTAVFTSDKDMYSLMSDKVGIYHNEKGKYWFATEEEVMQKFGVRSEFIPTMLSLAGDSVDNIPGVPGLGPKGAAKLIEQFKDGDAIFADLSVHKGALKTKLTNGQASYEISKKLVALDDTVVFPEEHFTEIKEPNRKKMLIVFDRLGMKAAKAKFLQIYCSDNAPAPRSTPSVAAKAPVSLPQPPVVPHISAPPSAQMQLAF